MLFCGATVNFVGDLLGPLVSVSFLVSLGPSKGGDSASGHLKLPCPSWPRVNDGDVDCSGHLVDGGCPLGWLTVMSTTGG